MGFLSMTKTSTKPWNWNQDLLPLLAFAAVTSSGCGSGLLSSVDILADGAAGASGDGSGGASLGGSTGSGGTTSATDADATDTQMAHPSDNTGSMDAQTADRAERQRWQKLPETPLLDVASMNRISVSMGDRITIFTTASSPNRTWSYLFEQDDWFRVSPGPAVTSEPGTVWTDTRLLYWGGIGFTGTPWPQGGLYDPVTDTWSPVSLDGALPLVVFGSAYTGQEVFMYGTTTGTWLDPGTGLFYNPSTDRWRQAPTLGEPTAQWGAVVGLGGRIMVWGGVQSDGTGNNSVLVGSGAVYDAITNKWTPMETQNAPGPRAETMIALAARGQAFLWGGTDYKRDSLGELTAFRDGAMYDPIRDLWTPISTANSPVKAVDGFWAEEQGLVYLWTGQDSPGATLWTYNPATDTWANFDIADLPALKQVSFHWTGSKLLVIGFVDGGTTEDAAASGLRLTGYLLNP